MVMMFVYTKFHLPCAFLSSLVVLISFWSPSYCQWDCFNRRSWSYYGTLNRSCVLTESILDCNYCQNWTDVIGNWTNAEELVNRYELDGNECRIVDNSTAPWCYMINLKGELTPGFCRIETCAVHAGCRNGTGVEYRGYGQYTESGYVCINWNSATGQIINPSTHPNSGLEENFCRNPDRRDRPWCYYQRPGSSEILSDFCQIDECTTDALSNFQQITNSLFSSHDHKVFENSNMTSEECAIACLQEESFSCRSFKFRDVHTYNARRCTLSSESIFTLGLHNKPLFDDYFNDIFTRIDKICDAFEPDFTKLPAECPLPLTTLLNNGRLGANITASSYMEGYQPHHTNVENAQPWIPADDTRDEYWQVCYSERILITGLVTRGSEKMMDGEGCWVNSFTLEYSLDGGYWWELLDYQDNPRNIKEFPANAEATCNSTIFLPNPLRTRCLRIKPVTWRNKICLSVSIIGCLDNDCDEAIGIALGRIHDNQIEASSWNGDSVHSSKAARVGYIQHTSHGWIPAQSSTQEWIQITFNEEKLIQGVVTQGCLDVEAWVESYTISYSNENVPYRNDNGSVVEFEANWDMMTLVRNDLDVPFVTLLVRVHPVTWYQDICLRLDFIGCQNRVCNERLGMESGGIPNEAIQASSYYWRTPPYNGRLHVEEADLTPSQPAAFWEARGQLGIHEWLQVDLPELHTVTGIITQGAGLQSELDWVITYRLAYTSMQNTNDSDKWLFYKDIEGNVMILPGNEDQNTEKRNTLERPIVTRRIRIFPYTWYRRRIRMRAEIIGCPLIGTGRVCGSEKGLVYGGKCYASVSSNADGACSDVFAEGSARATVKSSDIQNVLSDHVNDLVFESKTQLTIGAMKDGENEWMWGDGTPVIYEQFRYVGSIGNNMSTYCVALDGMARFTWTEYECQSVILRGTLCEIDIDECLSSENGCSHECVNDEGGYHCACPHGYRLDSNRRNCIDLCANATMHPDNSTVINEGSSCFYVMNSEEVTWSEAANQCAEIQSLLPNASDVTFLEVLNITNLSDVWVEDDISAAEGFCPYITRNLSEIILGPDDCDEQKTFICEREYADLNCNGVWIDDITSHVTSASVGHLHAYSYPPWYNELSACNFFIKGPENMNVRLNIIAVTLRQDPSNSHCLDALSIYDVMGLTNQSRGRFCGDINDVELIGQSNMMSIGITMWSLTADMPIQLGFEASYDMIDCNVIDCNAVCGETVNFHGPSGIFHTKDFPSLIPPFIDCEYNITVQTDRYISLHFDEFNIERERNSAECVDHVSIRTPNGILKRALCGNTTQPLIVSNSPTVIVQLETGLAGKSTGFSLTYNSTELGGCGFSRDTCSGVEYCSLPSAVFVSVNYPFPYSPNSQCRWSITTPEGSYVTITFLKFDVVSDIDDHDCNQSDFLVVYDGDDEDSRPSTLGRFCNANRPPSKIQSSLNAVVIEFASNEDDLVGDGFYAEYRATYTQLEVEPDTDIEYTCPSGWELFGSKCYQFTSLNQTIRWNDASKMCRDIDSFLGSIKTLDEMNFIHYMLTSSWFTGNAMNTYIGLTDNAKEGHFRWEDGGPLSYADWYIADITSGLDENSQPNGHEQEDCTMIHLDDFKTSANWRDIACASREAYQFICEQNAEANVPVISRIGDLSKQECPSGSRRIGDTCISLALTDSNETPRSPCQPIQSSILLPLSRLAYVLRLLWPFRSTPEDIYIDIQGVYNVDEQTLRPRRVDIQAESCHVMEYYDGDWQLVNRDCALAHNGSICYAVVSDLVESCGEDMFECMNGECIRSVHICDGQYECTDGEDEINCEVAELIGEDNAIPACPDSSFQCDMGRCISASFYCDFIDHCQDRSDEINCAYPTCKDDEFECTNGQCIEASLQCDIIPDCVDGSDEQLCQFCSGDTFQCYDGTCIPMRSVCDGIEDCRGLNMEDELSCESIDTDNTLRCLNGETLDARWRCLYDFDEFGLQQGCRDVTHLRDCGDIECFGNTFKCPNSYCLPLRRRCDGVTDCPGGEDELECEVYSCPGFLRCHGQRYCVTDDQICDGVKDCPDEDDEMFCDIDCPGGCSCDGFGFTCDSVIVWTPELAASISTDARRIMIANVSHSGRMRRSTDIALNQTTIDEVLYLNLSSHLLLMSLELPGNGIDLILPGTFSNQRNLKKLDLSRNNIWKLYTDTFHGLNRLTELDLSLNPLTVIQPGAFNYLHNLPFLALQNLDLTALEYDTFIGLDSVQVVNLADNDIMRIESGAFNGLNYTRTLSLDGNDIHQFKMDIFRGLNGLQHLSSDLFLFCCIVPDLESCYPPEDQFSSCEDLMRSNVLRIFMWILGFSAFIGNIIVMIERMRGRKKFSVQSFLIFNLAISDCLMGTYMLIIASVDAHFRDVYVFHAEDWKASFMCKLAGILANLSSEVSVLILTTISIDRFLCITFPFSQKHLGRKSARVAAALIWTASIIYSVIPALPFPYFGQRFYGRSGVCLALPLTNDKPPGWKYAMSGIFINFIAMVIIIGCYCVIYVIAKRSGSSLRSNKSMDAEIKLAVRTAVIVATDICCWLPIVILAFVSLTDSAFISPTVYAWIAVFVLPINSSINPYLYTISTINVKTRLASFRTRSNEFFTNSTSGTRKGMSNKFAKTYNSKSPGNSSSGERGSTRSIPMSTRNPDLLILSDALSLIRANKLHMKVDDVNDIRNDLSSILDRIHACAMTHGSIDNRHVIIEKGKESAKWTGSLIFSLAINVGMNGNCEETTDVDFDKLGLVIAELNDALGHGTNL